MSSVATSPRLAHLPAGATGITPRRSLTIEGSQPVPSTPSAAPRTKRCVLLALTMALRPGEVKPAYLGTRWTSMKALLTVRRALKRLPDGTFHHRISPKSIVIGCCACR